MDASGGPRVRLRPFQIVQANGSVLLRRGVVRVALEGEGVADAIAKLQEFATDEARSRSEIMALFPAPLAETVDALIRHLLDRDLALLEGEGHRAPRVGEDGEDIFFWHVGKSRRDITRLTSRRVMLVGVNTLSLALRDRLLEFGAWDIELVDDVPLRNHELSERPGDLPPATSAAEASGKIGSASLAVACAEFGGQALLQPWNSLAVEHNVAFFPVVVEDLVAYLGPLVIPGETACLACLTSRQNSNLVGAAQERRAMELFAGASQRFAASHPAIQAITANVAAFELLRFASGMFPRRIGKLVEFNLVSSAMISQRVLRAPRCPTCSSLRKIGRLGIEKRMADAATWSRIERMGGAHDHA